MKFFVLSLVFVANNAFAKLNMECTLKMTSGNTDSVLLTHNLDGTFSGAMGPISANVDIQVGQVILDLGARGVYQIWCI